MRYAVAGLGLAVVLALIGCQQQTAEGPSIQDYKAQRERLAAQIKKRQSQPNQGAEAAKGVPVKEAEPAQASFAAIASGYSYDPAGKRDPFRAYHWQRQERLTQEATRGPLEQFDLGQLSVIAVVWETDNARALIQDPSGRAYIVSEGTPVGKNQGRVIHIDDNLVLVKETYLNYEGEETTKDVELRIRRSQGG